MLRDGGKDASDDGPGSVALRNTLGVVAELSKEVEAFRKEQFGVWEVRLEERGRGGEGGG